MNNTTFSFNKKQIVQSVLEPDTHSIWLNSNDNKLYKFGNSGWEVISTPINIHRMFLRKYRAIDAANGMYVPDIEHIKENMLTYEAMKKHAEKGNNDIFLISLVEKNYIISGVINVRNQELWMAKITTGYDPNSSQLIEILISVDNEVLLMSKSLEDLTFRVTIGKTPFSQLK